MKFCRDCIFYMSVGKYGYKYPGYCRKHRRGVSPFNHACGDFAYREKYLGLGTKRRGRLGLF